MKGEVGLGRYLGGLGFALKHERFTGNMKRKKASKCFLKVYL